MHGSLLITYITNGDKCCSGSWEGSLIGGEETREQKKAFYAGSAVNAGESTSEERGKQKAAPGFIVFTLAPVENWTNGLQYK